ncbi:hypothetical protein DU500_05815 [Haloplanus rubicundus]|uniref:Uncharacterized protein n=1 Tax=Haloplanus rubicundus TaxID=1547898 RepID=A0A345E1C5_9EURY|nr:hypothetical protein [Haloplanus rubicundus]AXG05997.1 hypothetical protein DU500_05815 [Haloplanus rubicundus]
MDTDADARVAAGVTALSERSTERAGDEFTRAAWLSLADPRSDEELSPFADEDRGWVGEGLRWLVVAAVSYRVAGREARASRRGVEGIAVARDLQTTRSHPAQRACLDEFVADFRVAAGMDDADAAYRTAEDAYREAGDAVDDPRRLATTPLFRAATEPIQQVARGPANGEIAVEWDDLHGADPSDSGAFLARRAAYKRQRFPSLLARVVDAGRLAAPRGTTEYGNDSFRCPDCDSTDVNWIAGRTLCLRCSAPMARA